MFYDSAVLAAESVRFLSGNGAVIWAASVRFKVRQGAVLQAAFTHALYHE